MIETLKIVWPSFSLTSGSGSLSVTIKSGTVETFTSLPGDEPAVSEVTLTTGNILNLVFHLDEFNYPNLKVEYLENTGNLAFKEGEGWVSYSANEKTMFCYEPGPGESDLIFDTLPPLEFQSGNEGIILVGTLDPYNPIK